MTEVVVTGIGIISSQGSQRDAWQKILLGDSGIQIHQPFPEIPPLPLALIADRPQALTTLLVRVVRAALVDARLTLPLLAEDCAIVIGSSRSQQAMWEGFAREYAGSPNLTFGSGWIAALPHQPAMSIAQELGVSGPVLAPMAACATGLVAIAQGFDLIQSGLCQKAIVGAVEAPITPLTLAGFHQMGALASRGAYPFDVAREGLVLGEGGAILVLESLRSAQSRQATIYGRVCGFGWTVDAYHMSTPAPDATGAIVAMQQCLQRSQLAPSDVHFIHAHGTATELNDRHEAQLFQQIFPATVPISSTKGATGHTLGASGALGAAFCLLALQSQTLPPCVGLRSPAFNLNVIQTAQTARIETALCCSFGFGGQNVIVAFRG